MDFFYRRARRVLQLSLSEAAVALECHGRHTVAVTAARITRERSGRMRQAGKDMGMHAARLARHSTVAVRQPPAARSMAQRRSHYEHNSHRRCGESQSRIRPLLA